MDITKAVIPAAGLGTRFLPYTKSVPKEMLPLLNKPAIQNIVEEGIASSINQFFVITSKSKQAIANHFDSDIELESLLQEKNKEHLLSGLQKVLRQAHFTYIRQSEPLGLGHAILMARHSIGKEYFGVFLPDDIIVGKTPGLLQLIKVARQERASVIAVQEVPADKISAYGVISIKKKITPHMYQVANLVEKPAAKDAPSNLAVIGRYVLSHKIFDALDDLQPYATDELQLTDAISTMLKNGEKVIAYKIEGDRFDLGNPLGWLKANIHFGLQHPEYGPQIKDMLGSMSVFGDFIHDTTIQMRNAQR